METIVRPLSASEKRLLGCAIAYRQRRLRRAPRSAAVVSALIFSILWGATVLATLSNQRGPSWYGAGLIWLGIGIPFSLWSYSGVKKDIVKDVRRFESALRENSVREIRIQSESMVEFQEREDEGACYAFQLGNRRIVFVAGQEFYPSPTFPNSDFSIADIIDENGTVVVGFVRKRGRRIEPVRMISVQERSKLTIPEHLQVVEGELTQIEQLLVSHA